MKVSKIKIGYHKDQIRKSRIMYKRNDEHVSPHSLCI